MTKKEMFAYIANEMRGNEEVVNFCNHEIELLEKKASNKSATKTQKENAILKDTIVETLKGLGKVRISEIQSANEDLANLSNQKMSALLTQLVNDKVVTKTTEKKISYFSIEE